MNLEDFTDWRASPLTKEIFASIEQRIGDILLDLGVSAGRDSVEDARRSGAIVALRDVLNIEYEDTKQQ